MGTSWPPTVECAECANQTKIECVAPTCTDRVVSWLRNFTGTSSPYPQTWYYKYWIGDVKETTEVKSLTLNKDNVTVSYTAGNNSKVTYPSTTAKLVVKVFDTSAQTSSLNRTATVNFNVRRQEATIIMPDRI